MKYLTDLNEWLVLIAMAILLLIMGPVTILCQPYFWIVDRRRRKEVERMIEWYKGG